MLKGSRPQSERGRPIVLTEGKYAAILTRDGKTAYVATAFCQEPLGWLTMASYNKGVRPEGRISSLSAKLIKGKPDPSLVRSYEKIESWIAENEGAKLDKKAKAKQR